MARVPGTSVHSAITRSRGPFSPDTITSHSTGCARSIRRCAPTFWKADTTLTPSGTSDWHSSAHEPCDTPTTRPGTSPIAVASGTPIDTTTVWGASSGRIVLSVSAVCSNGTERITMPPRSSRVAAAFSKPTTSALATLARTSSAAATARSGLRLPITTRRPAAAKRYASPSPCSPVPPRIATASFAIALPSPNWPRILPDPVLRPPLASIVRVRDAPAPSAIEQAGPDTLRIRWSDGVESLYGVRGLRLACRCAHCVEEMTGRPLLDATGVPADVRPVRIRSVGRYALQFDWSDGHDTGIYTFEYLRQLHDARGT